jgi:DNA polymerase III epsilon subunit-like protein
MVAPLWSPCLVALHPGKGAGCRPAWTSSSADPRGKSPGSAPYSCMTAVAQGRPATLTRPPAASTPPPVVRLVDTYPAAPRPVSSAGSAAGVQFIYGSHSTSRQAGQPRLDGPYAVIDFETTGVSPKSGDRIIEVAIIRVDSDGRILDEYSTLLNPEGRDTGPVHVHRIRNGDVRDAPRFCDATADILARLEGAVVVAHNASFEQRFLDAELARLRLGLGAVPALCSLWLARRTLALPNYKLQTIALAARLSVADGHTALGDVRTVAALLPGMLNALEAPLSYGVPVATSNHLARGVAQPRAGLHAGTPIGQIAAAPVGHLRATSSPGPAPQRSNFEVRMASKPTGTRRCSACGQLGHYRPTCHIARQQP